MTQAATSDSSQSRDRQEHLAQQIHQLEDRLQHTDPTLEPTLYRSLYCMLSLRQKQLMSHLHQHAGQHRQAG